MDLFLNNLNFTIGFFRGKTFKNRNACISSLVYWRIIHDFAEVTSQSVWVVGHQGYLF